MDCPKTTGSGVAGLINATVWSIERRHKCYIYIPIYMYLHTTYCIYILNMYVHTYVLYICTYTIYALYVHALLLTSFKHCYCVISNCKCVINFTFV